MDQKIIDLYDRFTHGGMNRREFLERLTVLTGSAAGASAVLPLLQNNYAAAQTVAPNDPRLRTERVTYDVAGRKIGGVLAHPAQGTKFPAVIVIHENRGLNAHIEDVTRRLGLEGFLAFGVDLLSSAGGTPAEEDRAREMIGQLKRPDVTAELRGAVAFLESHPQGNGKVGAVGFCWGGGQVSRLAAASPDLDAGVSYYGAQLPAAEVGGIRAPLLLHYAGLDERINAGIPAYEQALKAAGKDFRIEMYPGANHAFNNDTNPARYDKAAADLAWGRTVAFLKQHLGEGAKG